MSEGHEDDDFDEPRERAEREPVDERAEMDAARRTSVPGAFLIFCGILNLLSIVLWVAGGMFLARMTVDEAEAHLKKAREDNPAGLKGFDEEIDKQIREKTGKDPKELPPEEHQRQEREILAKALDEAKDQSRVRFPICGGINLLAGILPIVAGVRMRKLRTYGLSVTGAITAAVPCVSLAACPCGLGLIFGIWAIVVLLNPEVRRAFR